MTKEKITPTHQNIFSGVKVEVTGIDRGMVTYIREVENDGLKGFKEFEKPDYYFKKCYEKL